MPARDSSGRFISGGGGGGGSFIEVIVSGPLFENGEQILKEWCEDLVERYGKRAESEIGSIMDSSFKNPTPYYETQVTFDQMGTEGMLHDRGIVYGPWLEGVGSRNATSRFKGYHMFRRTAQLIQEDVSITTMMVPELVSRLS